jgi:hypothetical protein
MDDVTSQQLSLDDQPQPEQVGFSGRRTAEVVGISYRQLDYWARTDLVTPSLAEARGSGSRRHLGRWGGGPTLAPHPLHEQAIGALRLPRTWPARTRSRD